MTCNYAIETQPNQITLQEKNIDCNLKLRKAGSLSMNFVVFCWYQPDSSTLLIVCDTSSQDTFLGECVAEQLS